MELLQRMREWVVPVAILGGWLAAAGFSVHALSGLPASLDPVPVMVAPEVVIPAAKASPTCGRRVAEKSRSRKSKVESSRRLDD
jgi:hypothetical protein